MWGDSFFAPIEERICHVGRFAPQEFSRTALSFLISLLCQVGLSMSYLQF